MQAADGARRVGCWLGAALILGVTIVLVRLLPLAVPVHAPQDTREPPAAPPPATSPLAPPSTPDRNAVYRADLQVSSVNCVLPRMGTTTRQLEAWVQASVTCLDNARQPVLATAGLPFSRPGVRRFSGIAPDGACKGDFG